MSGYLLGIDVGGTFTDVVLGSPSGVVLQSSKTLTTPLDPVAGCMEGVEATLKTTGIAATEIERVVHATTLATNLLLEGKGSRVGYIATEGFGDIPRIGRELRSSDSVYDLFYEKPALPVSQSLVFEAPERVDAQGRVRKPLEAGAIDDLLARVATSSPEAIAICLINSYVNPLHEDRIATRLRSAMPELYVAVSSEVNPVMREYDRAATTIVSAYVGPVLAAYMLRLAEQLREYGIQPRLEVMRADGGIVDAEEAVRRAVYCLESGPAAGVIAASYVAAHCMGGANVISFDMGGTTAKAGLVRNGRSVLTHELHVGGPLSGAHRAADTFPLKVESIDLSEVGSGGGSVAWVDSGGLLRVGPQSAGAFPGPACYGRGGVEPTTTDADVVLGFLDPSSWQSLESASAVALAHEAIDGRIARPLGMDVLTAARGIYDIANAMMAGVIRNVTVERGIDPRGFVLCGFGGAGPAHVVRVAAEFGIAQVIVPRLAGVLSGFGLLTSDASQEFVRSHLLPAATASWDEIQSVFQRLEEQALEKARPVEGSLEPLLGRSIDARFRHQTHELTIELDAQVMSADEIVTRFYAAYEERFSVNRQEPVELVTFRVRATLPTRKAELPSGTLEPPPSEDHEPRIRGVYSPEERALVPTAVYRRELLTLGRRIDGPAVIEDGQTSLVVPAGYDVEVDAWMNLIVSRSTHDDETVTASRRATADPTAVSVPGLDTLLHPRKTSVRRRPS